MPAHKNPGKPTVVLVGRPNVGKSTLFNRITGSRRAIVAPVPGTTRDLIADDAEWQGVPFRLVDTGGMFGASKDPLHELVVQQGRRAIETADLLVFVVDGREGLVPGDEEIAATLRQTGRPVVLAVNKTDDRRARARAVEFYNLGFEPLVEIAAEHGEGVGDLLDEIFQRLDLGRRAVRRAEEAAETKVAIIGRPNVGKSSLVNRLLREERSVVSNMPGTTRDPVDSVLRWQKKQFRIVDTAGIRRAGKVAQAGQIEAVSVMLARRAIARADVAVLLIDAQEGPTDQDATVAGEAERAGCSVIIAANKWDLLEDRSPAAVKAFDDEVRRVLKFLDYAPILHISAATGERTPRLLEVIDRVAKARLHRVPTGELNRFIEAVTAVHPPVSPGRKDVRVLYTAQTGVAPPTFVLFTNVATSFHFSYERFLQNRLRESFGFEGTPIRLMVRRRTRKAAGA
ncbi:MAG TPA: ribosome biogenesis GTPase Der [Vicinamibacterales bacterium]